VILGVVVNLESCGIINISSTKSISRFQENNRKFRLPASPKLISKVGGGVGLTFFVFDDIFKDRE
jgi:hypothetical protein